MSVNFEWAELDGREFVSRWMTEGNQLCICAMSLINHCVHLLIELMAVIEMLTMRPELLKDIDGEVDNASDGLWNMIGEF